MSLTPHQMTEALDRLPRVIASEVQRAALQLAVDLEGRAKTNAGNRLRRRSGNLMDSIRSDVTLRGFDTTIALRAGHPGDTYVAVQEGPGTTVITPKGDGFLYIPVGGAVSGSGVKRYAGPGSDPQTTVQITNRAGTAGVVLGRNREVRWIATKGPIRIQGKRFAGDAFDALVASFPQLLEQRLAAAAEEAFRG